MFGWLTDALRARYRTAMHEAGHAVVTYRLGFYLGRASVEPEAGCLGFAQGEGEWGDGSRDEDMIVTLYAGLAAERLVAPEAGEGAESDYEQAAELLQYVQRDQAALEHHAAALVAEHRSEIEGVATALFEEGTLEADDQDVIMDCVVEGDDWRTRLTEYRQCRHLTVLTLHE